MAFWDNVDEELKYRGMERKELGLQAGFPESYISKGISRGSSPQADLAVRIAQVLGVSVEYLVTGKNPSERTIKKNQLENTEALRLYRRYRGHIENFEKLSAQKVAIIKTLEEALINL